MPSPYSNVLSGGTDHDSDISIPSPTVGLSRNFGIMIRLASDMMFIARHARITPANTWSIMSFNASDIVEMHNYVEERLAPTWNWLISVMNSCEGHLRFGCAVSQRRGQSAQTTSTTTTSSTSGTSNEIPRSDQDRSSRLTSNYSSSRSRSRPIFLGRTGESEIRQSSVVGSTGTAATVTAPGSNINSGSNTQSTSNAINIEVNNINSTKTDFLLYSMSLVRRHFDEHYDSLPVFDPNCYKHVAYVFDAFTIYSLGGRFRNENQASAFSIFGGKFGDTLRNDPFYQRPKSTLFMGCPAPDPFSVPYEEALPLSVKPHLLKNVYRVEELFGIPRPSNSEEAKAYLNSLPVKMALSEPLDKRPNSSSSSGNDFKNSKFSSNSGSSSSGKASVIVLAGSAKHDELSSKKSNQIIEKKLEEFEKQNGVEFYFLNMYKLEKLVGSWRLSMEVFGKMFADDVGIEPLSLFHELSPFSVKEARFRREIEILDQGSPIHDIQMLSVEREREKLLKQTFESLNQVYKSASDKTHYQTKLKITFNLEPGEGSGVMRSFFSAFSDYIVSDERFTSMTWLDNAKSSLSSSSRNDGSHFSRIFRRTQNYLRVNSSVSNGVLLHRFIPPDGLNNSGNNAPNNFLANLNLRVNAPPYRPSYSLSSPMMPEHINDLLGNRFTVGSAQDLHNRVMSLQPALASRITGMLLELPAESISYMLDSEMEFHHAVNVAVDLINNDEASNGTGAGGDESSSNTTSSTPQRDDFEPLFYQPGPRGFYSPIAGKCSEARLNAFRNIGRIIGISLHLGELCKISLSRHVIAQILGLQPTWHDLAFFDSQIYESFRNLINDVHSPNAQELFSELDLRFSIQLTAEEGGEERDLIANGRNVSVTPENILDYVRTYSLYRMQIAQLPAIEAIRKGIFDILPKYLFKTFTPEDLRLLMNGLQDINVQTLQSYVTFINGKLLCRFSTTTTTGFCFVYKV